MVSEQKLPPPSLALQDVLCLLRWPWSEPGHWCQPLNSTSHGHTPLGEGKQETQRDRQRKRNRENETDMETRDKGRNIDIDTQRDRKRERDTPFMTKSTAN